MSDKLYEKGLQSKLELLRSLRDDESLAKAAYQDGHITEEERDEYNRIRRKAFDGRIAEVEEELEDVEE